MGGLVVDLRFVRPLRDDAVHVPRLPGPPGEAVICGIQSVCSWGNDVHSFGRPSKWKNADRLVASVNIMWQMCKLVWLEMTLLEYGVWIGGLCIALALFSTGPEVVAFSEPESPYQERLLRLSGVARGLA